MNQFEQDIRLTIKNKENLLKNQNLLFWYKKSYDVIFRNIKNIKTLDILEIGSGTSPISCFYSNIKTNDIMPLDFVDYHFDALEIDTCSELEGKTFDIITFSNVLHHIKKPVDFILKCEKRLKEKGKIIFLEPNFSLLSGFIYKYIHHEATDMKITKPEIENISGPLSTSNIALPFLIFFGNKSWKQQMKERYEINSVFYFTSLSYFLTGGISHKFPIPHFLYKIVFKADSFFAEIFPQIFSTFFILTLSKKLK